MVDIYNIALTGNKQFSGVARLQRLAQEAEDRWHKRQERDYKLSVTHAEQSVYRNIVNRTTLLGMSKGQRGALRKMLNLHFRHKGAPIVQCQESLADKMGVALNTFKKYMRFMMQHGFLTREGEGNGRGNMFAYRIHLGRIQQLLAPELTLEAGSDRVDLYGEVQEVPSKKASAGKVSNQPCPYKKTLNAPPSPVKFLRHFERFTVNRVRDGFAFTAGLAKRLAANLHNAQPEATTRQAHPEIRGSVGKIYPAVTGL